MKKGLLALMLICAASTAPLWAQSPAGTALAGKDADSLITALADKPVELDEAQFGAARTLLLEELALTAFDNVARRRSIGEALQALDPDDRIAKTLLENDTPAPAIETFRLPDGFENALAAHDGERLVDLVLADGFSPESLGERAGNVEELLIAYVRPLPASDALANRRGYEALARLDPTNATYSAKVQQYAASEIQQRSALLRRLDKETDSFNGVTFYKHPTEPRYADDRTYFLPYLAAKGDAVTMRFQAHYTNDSWLFVTSLSFNIDGEIRRFPSSTWKRDNDSEIWEWTDVVVNDGIRELLLEIANSNQTIARFDGQQYYDNVTVGSGDKQAIKDMFVAQDQLQEMLKTD